MGQIDEVNESYCEDNESISPSSIVNMIAIPGSEVESAEEVELRPLKFPQLS